MAFINVDVSQNELLVENEPRILTRLTFTSSQDDTETLNQLDTILASIVSSIASRGAYKETNVLEVDLLSPVEAFQDDLEEAEENA